MADQTNPLDAALDLDGRIAVIIEFAGLDAEQIARFRRGLKLIDHVIVHQDDQAREVIAAEIEEYADAFLGGGDYLEADQWARFVRTGSPRANPAGPTTKVYVPSPEQVEAGKSPKGGFTRDALASWGVPWPPPKGWRRDLRRRYEAGER